MTISKKEYLIKLPPIINESVDKTKPLQVELLNGKLRTNVAPKYTVDKNGKIDVISCDIVSDV